MTPMTYASTICIYLARLYNTAVKWGGVPDTTDDEYGDLLASVPMYVDQLLERQSDQLKKPREVAVLMAAGLWAPAHTRSQYVTATFTTAGQLLCDRFKELPVGLVGAALLAAEEISEDHTWLSPDAAGCLTAENALQFCNRLGALWRVSGPDL